MKKLLSTVVMLSILVCAGTAQTTVSNVAANASQKTELLIKGGIGFVKGGMPIDIPFSLAAGAGGASVNGSIAFPKNKIGINLGADFNYYIKPRSGISLTADFLSNAYKKIETTAPFNSSAITFTQKNQTNVFVGAGLIARKNFTSKLSGSAGLYGGMLWHHKKSYQSDYTVSGLGTATILRFAGVKPVTAIATKGALRVAYKITPKIAVSAGAELFIPFFSKSQQSLGLLSPGTVYSVYRPTSPIVLPGTGRPFDSSYIRNPQKQYIGTENSSKLKLYAFNIALKIGFGGQTKKPKEKKKPGKECCGECPVYGLAITARDKYTKEVLPNTDIAIKNKNGEIIKTGRTNQFGIYVVEKILKDDYTISGLLNNIALENSSVKASEMICDEVVQKEVVYADRNFVITGKAVVCNTTTPIAGINVTLENKDMAFKRSTMTDAEGKFVLQLPETGKYQLFGRKDSYFSQVEEVSASYYNREKTLFVKLEICAEKADCGTAIKLNNILFDLDKYAIKPAAAKELNRLVQFMIDNPGVRVELSSHTDCRASNDYNITLSQNRANASVDYIVSQGIDRSRLVGKGYGETKLLNRCADGVTCSEAEHAINRRTEMKVICPE